VSDVHDGVLKGLKANGVDARSLNFDDRLGFYSAAHVPEGDEWRKAMSVDQAKHLAARWVEAECFRWWPDVVIWISAFVAPPDVLELFKHRPQHTVGWFTEAPYEDLEQLALAPLFDTVVLNDPATIDAYRAVNERSWYLPHSFDPDIHRPGEADPDLRADFGFVGTGFAERVALFDAVDWSGISAVFGGNWTSTSDDSPIRKFLCHDLAQCMPNESTAALYRSVKASANLYRRSMLAPGCTAEGWAMGPREVELAASETFFLRDPRGEGDEILSMLPTFDGPDDFGEQLRWWVEHDSQRIDAARAARKAVADRSFKHTTAEFLRLIST
jgi:spore maturation protein CgeB